jgi:hypothetical protein
MGSGCNWTWPAYYGCKHCLEISESFTGDNGFYADRKFKMVDSEGQNCFENLWITFSSSHWEPLNKILLYIWFQSKLWLPLATILNFRWAQKVTRPVKDLKMNIQFTWFGICLDRMRDCFRFVKKWSPGNIGNIVSFSIIFFQEPLKRWYGNDILLLFIF